MKTSTIIQGRMITAEDIVTVQGLIAENPSWSQYRLSCQLAERWDWRNGKGQLKDIACRSLLKKMVNT